MPAINFAAQSYRASSPQLSAQRCVNMFVERSPNSAKDEVPIFMCPGLSIFSRAGRGGVIGMKGMAGVLYVVSGNQLFSVNESGLATLIGTTNLGGILSMATNDTQLVMVDGTVGWIYQPGGLNQPLALTAPAGANELHIKATGVIASGATISIPLDNGTTFTTTTSGNTSGVPENTVVPLSGTLPSKASAGAICRAPATVLGQIKQPAFNAANTVVYFDTYFVFDWVGTNRWFISASNDGTQYSGADYASASANSDYTLAVVNYHQQLFIFGQETVEIWYDAGAANFPFQRYDGAYIQRGIMAPLAVVQDVNSVFWLGDDGIFYKLNGYEPVRISTFAIEHAWAQYPIMTDAHAFVVTMEGHKFIFLNFPSGCATWCFDISSGIEQPLWHERESQGSPWV